MSLVWILAIDFFLSERYRNHTFFIDLNRIPLDWLLLHPGWTADRVHLLRASGDNRFCHFLGFRIRCLVIVVTNVGKREV